MRTLPHQTYTEFRGWTQRKPESHPAVQVTVSLCRPAYDKLDLPSPRNIDRHKTVSCLPDTGAQMVVAGPNQMHQLGITKRELIPLSNGVSSADNTGLGLLGGLLLNIEGVSSQGKIITTKQLCYIAEGIDCLFLSKQACQQLGIVSQNFPQVGEFSKTQKKLIIGAISTPPLEGSDRTCPCPARSLPPPVPTELPFPATEANVDKMKNWILDNYSSSAFNQCSHQPLPLVKSSPPLKLHIEPHARPVAVHKPVAIPLHWMTEIKEQLDRDVRLGVLEPVPMGEPVTWCSRMVVCPKKDVKPRRTVDLKALNSKAPRQTHATDSPFHQAVSVPKDTSTTNLKVA